MLWIEEVEMVESDDLKSSCSIRGTQTPDFEVLDAKIASALNRIIHNSRIKKKVSLEEMKAQEEDRFLGERQIAYLIYEYFRVTGAHDSVQNYADLFTIFLRNDDIQEFDSKRDGNLLSMTKIPSDDILEGLYKLRIRESEKLKTVLEICTMWRFIRRELELIITDWRQWSQEVSSKIYETGFLKSETEIMRQTPWSRIREQNSVNKELWEIVGNEKLTGNVLKETIAVSGTISLSVQNRHSRILLRDLLRGRVWEMHREPEVLEAEVQVEECLDCRARITSKDLAPLYSVKSGILQKACSTSQKNGCRFGGKSSFAHRQVDELPSKRSKKEEWWQKCCGYAENYTTIGLRISRYGAAEVFIDFEEELKHTEANPMCSIHKSRRTSCWHSRKPFCRNRG